MLKIPNQKVQIEFSTKKVELDQKSFETSDLLGHDMFVSSQRCFLILTIVKPKSYLGVEFRGTVHNQVLLNKLTLSLKLDSAICWFGINS